MSAARFLRNVFLGTALAASPDDVARGQKPVPATASVREDSQESESRTLARAIEMLVREFEGYRRVPNSPLRAESSYFKENTPTNVRPETVIAILEWPAGRDVQLECYVKWQLLSAIEGTLIDAACADRMSAVYRRTPWLMVRPGMTPREKHELKLLAQGRQLEDQQMIEDRFLSLFTTVNAYNWPILKYRDELRRRLPTRSRVEALAAGFEDVRQRYGAGVDEISVEPLLESLVEDTRAWMAGGPPVRELRMLSRTIARLANATGPTWFDALKWTGNAFRWTEQSYDINEHGRLDRLADDLRSLADERRNSTPATRPS